MSYRDNFERGRQIMGQKVNPNGFRLGVSKKQNANWYAKGKDFSNNLIQDLKAVSYTHLTLPTT